jgi:hypothetical protein
MTTVITTPDEGQVTRRARPPQARAYAYLITLVRAQAPLRETKALASTGICEAHRRGLTDTRRSWHWRDDGRPVDITILRAA